MAQRLATEYVKASLQLTEAQMTDFLQSFAKQHVQLQVKVLDNGNQDIVLEDGAGEELHLPFARKDGRYVCEMSCRLVNPKLTDVMRKAVAAFKGDAIVNRIYSAYTMEYRYAKGAVNKIIEHAAGRDKTVFELRDTAGQLQRMFDQLQVEQEIERTQSEVDALLDLRNLADNPEQVAQIDRKLKDYTKRLFILEA